MTLKTIKIRHLFFSIFILFVWQSVAYAKYQTVNLAELEPEEKHVRASELITHILKHIITKNGIK